MMAAIDDLIAQIQGQGTTSKWSGGYGADAATKDMARILSSIGITDINQFGKVPTYEPVQEIGKTYNGLPVRTYYNEDDTSRTVFLKEEPDGEGGTYSTQVDLPKDAKLETVYGLPYSDSEYGQGYNPVDPSKVKTVDGRLVADTGQTTFGNKLTGQVVPNTYSERQTGNAFGGTYEGKGNTGYRVDFSTGTPVFYTTGASSSDAKNYAPVLALAGLAFGAPMLGKFLAGAGAAGSAGALGLTATEAAGLGLTFAEAASLGLSASEFAAATAAGAAGSAGVGAGLLESVFDPTLGGTLTTEGLPALDGLISPVEITGTPSPDFDLVSPVEMTGTPSPTADLVSPVEITGTPEPMVDLVSPVEITGTPAPSLVDKAVAAASKLSVSDAIRLAGIGATLAGGAKLVGSAGGTGSGGFPIVPIPADWTSPPPTSTAAFTPLPEIDFGNKEMLRGTQWERLLSPDYGKAPAPTQYAQPNNMSYDELTRILGGSRTSVPTQNLTINDVISGIQNQYGQAPKSSVG